MKKIAAERGLALEIASAATSDEERGNPVYPPAKRVMAKHGIDCSGKRARRLTRADYEKYDMLIGMDSSNLRNMKRICGGDPAGKMSLLLDWAERPGDAADPKGVADPWYTGDFEATWRDVNDGCRGIADYLEKKR